MKKILSIIFTVFFIFIIVNIQNVSAEAFIETEESIGTFVEYGEGVLINPCEDGIGICDCGITYQQHEETLKKINEEGISTRDLICDCGGLLTSKLVYTGDWYYSSAISYSHNKNGSDYIYERRNITSYKCNSCSFYKEVDRYETENRCKGV